MKLINKKKISKYEGTGIKLFINGKLIGEVYDIKHIVSTDNSGTIYTLGDTNEVNKQDKK